MYRIVNLYDEEGNPNKFICPENTTGIYRDLGIKIEHRKYKK